MLELCGIWSTPSLQLLQAPLCLGMVAPDRVLSMGQIGLTFELSEKMTYAKLKCLKYNCLII